MHGIAESEASNCQRQSADAGQADVLTPAQRQSAYEGQHQSADAGQADVLTSAQRQSAYERQRQSADAGQADVLTPAQRQSAYEAQHQSAEGQPVKLSCKPRKRQCNMESWKRNRRKHGRQHGLAYTSSTGKLVKEKQACLSGCLCQCKLKCSDRLTAADRQQLFDSF